MYGAEKVDIWTTDTSIKEQMNVMLIERAGWYWNEAMLTVAILFGVAILVGIVQGCLNPKTILTEYGKQISEMKHQFQAK